MILSGREFEADPRRLAMDQGGLWVVFLLITCRVMLARTSPIRPFRTAWNWRHPRDDISALVTPTFTASEVTGQSFPVMGRGLGYPSTVGVLLEDANLRVKLHIWFRVSFFFWRKG